MSYWWQNIIIKKRLEGETILRMSDEGCQARNEFQWAGKVVGFEKGTIYDGRHTNCEYIIIEIMIHNYSYGDARGNKEPELYKYPLVNADIQNVNGVWILFA